MNELFLAFERTLELLNRSEDSLWSTETVDEMKSLFEKELAEFREKRKFSFWGKCKIRFLFLPTGALQETANSNGWHDEYMKISRVVDNYMG